MVSSCPRYFQAWIAFFAITTLIGAIAGGIVGALIGIALKDSNTSRSMIIGASALAGFLINAPISFYTFRWAVRTILLEPLTRHAS